MYETRAPHTAKMAVCGVTEIVCRWHTGLENVKDESLVWGLLLLVAGLLAGRLR